MSVFFFFPFRVKTGTTRGSCIAAGMNQLQLVSLSCLLEIPLKGLEKLVLLSIMKVVIFHCSEHCSLNLKFFVPFYC